MHNVHGIGEKHSPPRWSLELSASVLGVRAVCWVGVVSQHVVVHVNGGAVVKGVTQALGKDGLARVRGQAKKEETGLSGWKSVDGLNMSSREKKKANLNNLTLGICSCNQLRHLVVISLPCPP